jgi:hypothetical protein
MTDSEYVEAVTKKIEQAIEAGATPEEVSALTTLPQMYLQLRVLERLEAIEKAIDSLRQELP